MRNLFRILFLIGICGLSSCSNDLDLVAPDEPVPVICFRMDPSDSLFYLTLTHTFSGTENGFDLSRDPQKVFYQNADIRLENWIGDYKVGEIRFSPVNRIKNPGLFPEVPGYCFQAYNELSVFNNQDAFAFANTFRLVVDVKGKLGPVNATVPLIPLLLPRLKTAGTRNLTFTRLIRVTIM